ncbi:MAG: hypothetical protein EPO52_10325 [Herbiconiux sp.]|uniref:hypothetical protein n=1 Tax=Herbiconiux sp. TaxID=1871186 RepID=UPI0012191303|nr:hypothetical protein [Herbiconiux sp.]TAJ48510.1 MAG: hypothetical protein EPO52_10325 [Herbiconiux sp.]
MRTDRVKWWAGYLADELAGHADVVYEELASTDDRHCPGRVGSPALVSVTPLRPTALPFTVHVSDDDVPVVRFGEAAEVNCFGIPSSDTTGGLDPSNHLGVMAAAVISDGATLLHRRGRRRTLVLGPLGRHPGLARHTVVQEWTPYSELYGTMTMFRRPPAYDELPVAAFVVPGRTGRLPRARRPA